ncbi:DUF1684 domain-containing protein [Arthrospiribacter ruber]|uniref:DUF1684 domain-containing protein n=1 Tax=Arthrospiribacter ruber TaxID=2487934 RepID=A0A951IY60_9BACT|nr:DUF1684 domain-containing protein [Arthrospiribacter ruber]MBW3468227.1 DUF1684 domain-containing protein [Arthrospiribacter ruber]
MELKIRFVLLILVMISCTGRSELKLDPESYREKIDEWHEAQMDFLRSDEGYLNLIGLHWLEDGKNSFGTKSVDLKVIHSDLPDVLGYFILEEDKVFFEPQVSGIQLESKEVNEKVLIFDLRDGLDLHMDYGSLHWNIIKRGDKFGVRLRDLEAKEVIDFEGVDRFPVDLKWRIKARFVPYEPVKEIMISNVVGQVMPNISSGYVEFEFENKLYRLDALANPDDDELFLMFADKTSGDLSYGGGRYMYVDRDFTSEEIILDFNKAYNPPCVYTAYATCPLPPKQNVLDLEVNAGHKNFGKH